MRLRFQAGTAPGSLLREPIMRQGVRPRWKSQHSRHTEPPKYHGSATRALNTLAKNIRKGQDANQDIVLDIGLLDVLDGLTCSPFGAVEKGSVPMDIDARIMHDVSFPGGGSVNDETLPGDAIGISYDGATVLKWHVPCTAHQVGPQERFTRNRSLIG
ncbi:unnamed protein product [Phytophthora fragariaefolia]|uniref:Unnamed protein product n=1 Tax=Phytophthora fragariaefolia TaxID=1490495 RepID=A0A9W7CYK1_9STRA|nr:unnamed protein product [Phytophthora fragariaefolia]